ncbi:MAG TPA: ribonuclease [Candidatus Corynebacterium gallistercoris]|uniref:Ribonuclease n=1 Tax=Candidatus Corynebacterium gallistercoris TaxID=2838530 RepID=A0A9D1UQV5_9CORY|nr:ribonuclease [Candidatus Corynebacterium gallistercoris]
MASNNKKWGAAAGAVVPVLAAVAWFSSQTGEETGAGRSSDTSTGTTSSTSTGTSTTTSTTGDSCSYDTLPAEAQTQIDDILTGAPADDGHHDGKHFGNYEGLLPQENSSYYREYTVKTPGLSHRGERRIVVGGGTEQDPDVWYYTSDHFESFCSIPDAEG